ncbi:hypothetical protein HanIR_Chr12g0587951 [Helianthus annuus]|nr:hypothetical protein HanIR_Chr12g0587951 [Helianthus annuus]
MQALILLPELSRNPRYFAGHLHHYHVPLIPPETAIETLATTVDRHCSDRKPRYHCRFHMWISAASLFLSHTCRISSGSMCFSMM